MGGAAADGGGGRREGAGAAQVAAAAPRHRRGHGEHRERRVEEATHRECLGNAGASHDVEEKACRPGGASPTCRGRRCHRHTNAAMRIQSTAKSGFGGVAPTAHWVRGEPDTFSKSIRVAAIYSKSIRGNAVLYTVVVSICLTSPDTRLDLSAALIASTTRLLQRALLPKRHPFRLNNHLELASVAPAATS